MTLKKSRTGRRASAASALACSLLVAACGGGEQENDFKANRVVAFGDESSLIVDRNGNANGFKYSINATVSDTDPTISCASSPLWIQSVGNIYGLVFPECNTAVPPAAAPRSRIRAAFGARAADLGAQIDAQQAEGALGNGDLVTVLVGENDVIAQYAQYPATSEAEIAANLDAAGAEVGRQVNRLAGTGAKVLIATIVDVGVTPFAVAEKTAHTDTDRAALLTRLSVRFNTSLRATFDNDGRRIGLVLLDEFVSVVVKFPGLNGFTNTTQGACDLSKSALTPPSILDCTNLTLFAGATPTSFLWADDRHLSAGGQTFLGNAAITRARNNPF